MSRLCARDFKLDSSLHNFGAAGSALSPVQPCVAGAGSTGASADRVLQRDAMAMAIRAGLRVRSCVLVRPLHLGAGDTRTLRRGEPDCRMVPVSIGLPGQGRADGRLRGSFRPGSSIRAGGSRGRGALGRDSNGLIPGRASNGSTWAMPEATCQSRFASLR